MQQIFLKAISNHKKRNKKSGGEEPRSSWWPVVGGTSQGLTLQYQAQYFSSCFFSNSLHGEQGSTQFADGTDME